MLCQLKSLRAVGNEPAVASPKADKVPICLPPFMTPLTIVTPTCMACWGLLRTPRHGGPLPSLGVPCLNSAESKRCELRWTRRACALTSTTAGGWCQLHCDAPPAPHTFHVRLWLLGIWVMSFSRPFPNAARLSKHLGNSRSQVLRRRRRQFKKEAAMQAPTKPPGVHQKPLRCASGPPQHAAGGQLCLNTAPRCLCCAGHLLKT